LNNSKEAKMNDIQQPKEMLEFAKYRLIG